MSPGKTPYAYRFQELKLQGIDPENIKPQLVKRFMKKSEYNVRKNTYEMS